MNRLNKTLLITVLLLGGILWLQHRRTIRLTEERDRFRMNSTALLSDVKRMRIDSATMALDAKALRLTIDEYKEFRAEDAETIRRLGVKIRNLEAAARHEVEVKAPIDAVVRDTLIVRDTVPLLRQKVEMVTPHIHFSGLIEENRLKGDIKIPVTLNQAVWVEYKMVVLEEDQSYPSGHIQQQPVCGNQVFGIHQGREALSPNKKAETSAVFPFVESRLKNFSKIVRGLQAQFYADVAALAGDIALPLASFTLSIMFRRVFASSMSSILAVFDGFCRRCAKRTYVRICTFSISSTSRSSLSSFLISVFSMSSLRVRNTRRLPNTASTRNMDRKMPQKDLTS